MTVRDAAAPRARARASSLTQRPERLGFLLTMGNEKALSLDFSAHALAPLGGERFQAPSWRQPHGSLAENGNTGFWWGNVFRWTC